MEIIPEIIGKEKEMKDEREEKKGGEMNDERKEMREEREKVKEKR